MDAIFDEMLTLNKDPYRKSDTYKAMLGYHIGEKFCILFILFMATSQFWMLSFLSSVLPDQSNSVAQITRMPKCENPINFEILGTRKMCVFS